MMFFLGLIIGAFIGIGMVAMLDGDSYEDGYWQAVKDMNNRQR